MESAFKHELENLRAELARLREELAAAKKEAMSETVSEAVSEVRSFGAQAAGMADDFQETMREFVEDAEEEFANHPLWVVGSALIVGILIGRFMGR
jgi:ElaB/YqjD/DUF883 family membrane-anchored ribosome-binding protein